MTIVIEDLQTESLARQMALAQGVSIHELVRKSLLSLADEYGIFAPKQPLCERLTAMVREVNDRSGGAAGRG